MKACLEVIISEIIIKNKRVGESEGGHGRVKQKIHRQIEGDILILVEPMCLRCVFYIAYCCYLSALSKVFATTHPECSGKVTNVVVHQFQLSWRG